MKRLGLILFVFSMIFPAYGASVIATVGGNPITDTDITARTKLMARQGNTSTNNRRIALQNIIDDYVKLNYASNFGVNPSDADVENELKKMNLSGLSASEKTMAKSAIRANIAWQIVVARTILPTVDVSTAEVNAERNALARAQGLPIEMTIVRLIDVPESVYNKLTKPKSCDAAIDMAESFGGTPQKFTAMQYELAPEIRERVIGLSKLTWSKRVDGTVLLVCDSKKTSQYGKLDEMIKQNAEYKQAMSIADQQLKQLRRRAVVIINDDRYKL